MIEPPRQTGRYPDRHIECQASIESALVALIDDANAAGWTINDVTTAIIDLADHIMLQHATIAELQAFIERLRKNEG